MASVRKIVATGDPSASLPLFVYLVLPYFSYPASATLTRRLGHLDYRHQPGEVSQRVDSLKAEAASGRFVPNSREGDGRGHDASRAPARWRDALGCHKNAAMNLAGLR